MAPLSLPRVGWAPRVRRSTPELPAAPRIRHRTARHAATSGPSSIVPATWDLARGMNRWPGRPAWIRADPVATCAFAPLRETCNDRLVTARFLIVGEALTDIVVDADGARREHPGGSPLNVAVALSRLGHPTDLLTRVGNDARGDAIRAHLQESGVRLTPGSSVDASTSTAQAVLDAHGAATYEFDLLWDPDASGLPTGFDAVHTSSIAAVLSPGAATVTDVLRRHREHATISYDPNARPSLMGDAATVREQIEATIALSDVVKASDEDVAWLYGTDDLEDVVASWRDLGPALTVMTRGAEGAVGFAAAGRVQVSPVVVDTVDTVGAGDTFSAGILDGLAAAGMLGAQQRPALAAMPSDEVAAVLRRAAGLAAITVSRAGANPPWSHELT